MAKTATKPTVRDNSGTIIRNILGKPSAGMTRAALEQYAILPENRELLKRVQALEAEIGDKNKWRDYSQDEKAQYIADRIHEIQIKHYTDCQTKRQEVAKKLHEERARWEKANVPDAATRQITWQRYQAELALMTRDELAAKLRDADNTVDPDWLYVAGEHCANHYADVLPDVKSAIANTHADQPWLRDEGIKQLHDLVDTYAVEYGQVKLHPDAAGTELVDDIQGIFTEVREWQNKRT